MPTARRPRTSSSAPYTSGTRKPPPPMTASFTRASLQVVLDRALGADLLLVGVLAGAAAGAAAAQQVVALVQLDLDHLHALVRVVVEAAFGLRPVQEVVLLLDKALDAVGDLL